MPHAELLGRHSHAFAEVLGEGALIAEAARSESWFGCRGACRNSGKRWPEGTFTLARERGISRAFSPGENFFRQMKRALVMFV